jgi:hypothetical protein
MISVTQAIERLTFLCEIIPAKLEAIKEADFAFKPSPSKWSKKEILGHMIDSATNNHQRFIRIQYENEPVIFYDQDQWNELSHYKDISTSHLIGFWSMYNQHIIEVVKVIPEENCYRFGVGKDGQKLPLHFYITDYVSHLEHHLKQLLNY